MDQGISLLVRTQTDAEPLEIQIYHLVHILLREQNLAVIIFQLDMDLVSLLYLVVIVSRLVDMHKDM